MLDALFEWLVDGAPGADSPPAVVERLGEGLVAAGVPVDRIAVFVETLHPNVLGRSFRWRRGEAVAISELRPADRHSLRTIQSPIAEISRTRAELRRRLAAGLAADDYAVLHEFAADGFTDFFGLPILFTNGQAHVVTFATRDPAGFREDHLAGLRRVLRPLARVTEIFALRRVASNLLSTYVGRGSGERILAGRIFKGDIEAIRAALWFSDLRGFTELSAQQTPRETIDLLNELFECQVPAIEARGGEVLKFIGDGLLAIFPYREESEAPAACEAALAACEAALAAIERRNAGASREIRVGVALHVGEVAYGNIGGASRLDFTAIGPAVNLAARLEGLTGRLGRPVVVSAEFARQAGRPLVELGEFELKGVAGPQRVYAPAGP